MPTKLLTGCALVGATLLGCGKSEPPSARPEQHAFANFVAHLKPYRAGGGVLRPVSCDHEPESRPMLRCHAKLVGATPDPSPAAERAVAFSCSVKPEGVCVYVAERNDATPAADVSTSALACDGPLHVGLSIEVADLGPVTVSEYVVRDTPELEWTNASFTLQRDAPRLTEQQVRTALDRLLARLERICRSYPAERTRVFLYPAGVTAGESANWIARADDRRTRQVDLNHLLLKDERVERHACEPDNERIASTGGTKLPALHEREILGTWVGSMPGITMSLERVRGKVHRVYRSPYCGSGNTGELVDTGAKDRFRIIGSVNGDYYQMTPSGDLAVFDRGGKIDVMPKHPALFPALMRR